ncbi:MAG TPA: phage tail length tape measure family protein, partial [Gallionella sp.]|nr:phage tail length tape measure family protein [Gallionella sp.]
MDGSGNLVGEAKAARDEIVNLKNATNDLAASNRSYAVTSRETAEYVMGMSIALSNAKDKAWALANGYSEVDGQLVRLNKTTQDAAAINAGATRELMVLGHEVMTGNFSRMPGTLLVLANRSGLAASGMLGMATAIAAPVVALGALAVAVHEGTKEMEAMDNALAVTSNYSGMTRGNMDSLAASMAQSGQVSIGTSREIVTQLVASGRIGAEAIGTVAQLTSNYAHATGQDISKIAPEMVKLFSDPLKGAEELNKSMHFLTAADVEHIATLQRLGQTQEAQLFLAQKVTDHLPKETENVGFLSAAYRSLKKDITDTWDAMMGLGKEMTPEAHLAKAKADMASLETKKGTGAFSPEYLAQLEKQYTIALNFYEAQVKMNAEKATAAATTTKELDDGLKIAESTRNNDSAHIKALEDERDFLEAHGVQTAAMLEREKAITREIGNIKRSMGAEARQASEAQITQQEKLGEVTLAMAAESNDTQLKLGQISKAQHDATRTAL